MDTTILNVRIDSKVKKQAAKVAESLGLTLSSVVNGYLRQLIKTKRVDFSESYEPTPYLERQIKRAMKERKEGKYISFDKAEDAVKYLDRFITDAK